MEIEMIFSSAPLSHSFRTAYAKAKAQDLTTRPKARILALTVLASRRYTFYCEGSLKGQAVPPTCGAAQLQASGNSSFWYIKYLYSKHRHHSNKDWQAGASSSTPNKCRLSVWLARRISTQGNRDFLDPMKWHRAFRRVPFRDQKVPGPNSFR